MSAVSTSLPLSYLYFLEDAFSLGGALTQTGSEITHLDLLLKLTVSVVSFSAIYASLNPSPQPFFLS